MIFKIKRLIIYLSISLLISVLFILILKHKSVEDNYSYRSAKGMIHSLKIALAMYQEDFDEYPPSGNVNLVACLQAKFKKGPYITFNPNKIKDNKLLDPWGTPYRYLNPGIYNSNVYDIYSCGSNRKDDKGKKDDIGNW